jgi:hypothetical protein
MDPVEIAKRQNQINPQHQLSRVDYKPDGNGDYDVTFVRQDGQPVPTFKWSQRANFFGMLPKPTILPAGGAAMNASGQILPKPTILPAERRSPQPVLAARLLKQK